MSVISAGIEQPGAGQPDIAPAAGLDRRRWLALVTLVVAQLVAGVAVGLIWRAWAPRAVSYMLSDGSGGRLVIPDDSEAQVAGDGRFVVLTVLAGLLFGLLFWQLRRQRGPLTIAVLGLGSVLGSVVARAVGQWVSGGSNSAPINTAFHPRLVLHAGAALWLQAMVAVLVYTALIGLGSDPSLGRGDPDLAPLDPVTAADSPA